MDGREENRVGKVKEVSHALVEYVRASHVGAVGAPPH